MTGKLMDIGNHDGSSLTDPGPANSFVFFKYLAGKRPLVGFHSQFPIAEKVKAGPEVIPELVMKQSDNGCHPGVGIPGFLQQPDQLFLDAEVPVLFGLRVHGSDGEILTIPAIIPPVPFPR
jgi:hypothetical protein